MIEFLKVIGYILFFIVIFGALVSIVFNLPGLWLILFSAIIFSSVNHFSKPSLWILFLLFVLAGFGELIEFLIGIYGVRKYGGSKQAVVGAIFGGIIGAILLGHLIFLVGAILGAFLGSIAGAFIVEWIRGREIKKAFSSATGAFIGRMGAILAKASIGAAMCVLIVFSIC